MGRRALAVAVVALIVASEVGSAATAVGSRRAAPPTVAQGPVVAKAPVKGKAPSELWRQFPLGKALSGKGTLKTAKRVRPTPSLPPATAKRVRPTPSIPPATTTRPVTNLSPEVLSPEVRSTPLSSSESKSTFPLLAVLAGTAALGGALFVGVFALRRRRGLHGAQDPPPHSIIDLELKWLEAMSTELHQRRADPQHSLARSDNASNKVHPLFAKRTDSMSKAAQPEDQTAADEPTESRSGYAELGDRVASVLERAQEVAEQIRAEAEEEAAHIQSSAKEAAEAHTREIELEHTRIRKDAEEYAQEIRQTGEAYASQIRRETDEAARKVLSEADAQARAIREAAEEMRKRIELVAQKRKAELQSELGTLEARLERLFNGLTTMAGQTERLLAGDVEVAPAGSLVDALDVQRNTVA